MDLDKKIAHRIRTLRINAELTQEEMSELVNIDTSSLAKIERGDRSNIKINTLGKIIQGFGITPKEFFDFSKEDISKENIFLSKIQTMLEGLDSNEKLELLAIFESITKIANNGNKYF